MFVLSLFPAQSHFAPCRYRYNGATLPRNLGNGDAFLPETLSALKGCISRFPI